MLTSQLYINSCREILTAFPNELGNGVWFAIDKIQDKTNYRVARTGELADASNPSNPFVGQWYPGYPITGSHDCIATYDLQSTGADNFKPWNYNCATEYSFGCEY